MANLNLSQFTEKTFVADADWTFVWDTAGLISKKVSRNNWLNSGELTTSAPVTISQTWNAVGQTFKALVVNAAGTSDANSATGSLLLDLQVNGTSKAWVTKQGGYRASIGQFVGGNGIGFAGVLTGIYTSSGDQLFVAANSSVPIEFKSTSIVINSTVTLGFGQVGVSADTILVRDSASGNTLALRNGINPQTFNVYGTYSSGSVYERMFARYDGTALAFQVGTQHVGATARPLQLLTDNTARWTISTAGHLLGAADNTYDIGASGANRPRNVYVGSQLAVGTNASFGSFIYAAKYYWDVSKGLLDAPSDGVFTFSNRAATDFGRLQFGGTTASFPALKRSTTTLQARLADDSAFAPIQGKLTTDTAFTSGAITDTGYIVLYDSTGTAYKVACTPV